jgi:general secretion pathway protein G
VRLPPTPTLRREGRAGHAPSQRFASRSRGEGQGGGDTGDERRISLTPAPYREGRQRLAGFTLIELLVVFAILALLVSLAAPRYFAHIERAKEATLKQDLNIMRDAIDKFYGDKGRYPNTLEELVEAKYIRNLPVDPITESATTWRAVPPPADANAKGEVYDVKSGAEAKGTDGKPYADW